MENPIKMDDLGVPWGTTIFGNIHILVGRFNPFEKYYIVKLGIFPK